MLLCLTLTKPLIHFLLLEPGAALMRACADWYFLIFIGH